MVQFDCEHIVKMLGVCVEAEPYYIILELMDSGDLQSFLRLSRPNKVKHK